MRRPIAVLVASALSFVCAFALVDLVNGRGPERSASALDLSSPLLIAGRTELSVCVQAADNPDLSSVEETLLLLQSELAEHPKEESAWMKDARVSGGCTLDPAVVDPTNTTKNGGIRVESASPHRLFLYVGDSYFKDAQPFRVSPAEFLCSGDSCGEVTTAVAVRSLNAEDLRPALIRALGLVVLDPSLFPKDLIGGLPEK